MKNEKHVDTANEIFEYLYEHVEAPSFVHEGDNWKTDVKKKIISALQQVESEALASKVVFPTDETVKLAAKKDIGLHREDNRPKTCTNNDFYMAVTSAFERGAKWALSRLTLAPNETEVKAQVVNEVVNKNEGCKSVVKSFEEWINNPSVAPYSFTSTRDFYEHIWNCAFREGQKSKAATPKLPSKLIEMTLDTFPVKEPDYARGWNDCLDAVKSMNEGGE